MAVICDYLLFVLILLTTSVVCGDKRTPAQKRLSKSTQRNLNSDCIQPMEADVMNYHGCGFPDYDMEVFEEKKPKRSQLK